MSRLTTILDLQANSEDENSGLVDRARQLCTVCEEILATDKGDGHTRAPGIHASEISGCKRKIVYSLLGTERRDQAAPIWRERFRMGHVVHALLQKQMHMIAGLTQKSDLGWHISFEDELEIAPRLQRMAKKWDIYSHCDGIFTIRESWDGPAILRIALEIKSEAPDSYSKLKGVKPDHVEQGHVYMACLDVPMIWFLYFNKGNQNYTNTDQTYLLQFDPRLWKSLEERFEECHDYAAAQELPPKEESVKCEFCAFSWTCQPACVANRGNVIYTRPLNRVLRGP